MKLEKRYPRRFKPRNICTPGFTYAEVSEPGGALIAHSEDGTSRQWGDSDTEVDAENRMQVYEHWRNCETFDHHADPAPEAKAVDVGTEFDSNKVTIKACWDGNWEAAYEAALARIATLEADAKLRSEVLAERDEQLKHERAGRADAERRVRELDLHCEEVTAERDNARRTWHTFANISKSSRRIADEYAAELRRQSQAAWMRGDIVTADRIAELIGDPLPSQHEAADSSSAVGGEARA